MRTICTAQRNLLHCSITLPITISRLHSSWLTQVHNTRRRVSHNMLICFFYILVLSALLLWRPFRSFASSILRSDFCTEYTYCSPVILWPYVSSLPWTWLAMHTCTHTFFKFTKATVFGRYTAWTPLVANSMLLTLDAIFSTYFTCRCGTV